MSEKLEPAAWIYKGPYKDRNKPFVDTEYVNVWNPDEPLVRVSDVRELIGGEKYAEQAVDAVVDEGVREDQLRAVETFQDIVLAILEEVEG